MSQDQIYAKVIKDSISPWGHRLTSFEVRFHRFVLAEVNTHRKFSRNSASSRAIPFRKQYEKVMTNPAVPVSWPAEQKGMQGGDEIETPGLAQRAWISAAQDAAQHARNLAGNGVHKSVTNRLLEPFQMHTAVITATDWDGFWDQRCSPLAQPELRVAAEMMKEAYDLSEPVPVREGFWHLPYIDADDIGEVEEFLLAQEGQGGYGRSMVTRYLVMASAARCARVSYETQDGVRDIGKDLDLYDRLVTARPAHFSPLEHPATPWPDNVLNDEIGFQTLDGEWTSIARTEPIYGNFTGWRQHRLEVEVA